ncbi:MAG: metallophosphoesterase [Planctomycetia bacterium]|nr:metallophosphoesterase [Planctomycetia bacterium]
MSSKYRRANLETQVEQERVDFFQGLKNLDRRSFLKVAAASFGAAASVGMLSNGMFQTIQFANAQDEAMAENGSGGFKIAYISDSHLYVKEKNDRFANALMRAVQDVNALEEQPDFVFYGGDLAQLGQPEELQLGYDILSELKAPLKIMVGEHDWYFDMGEKWKSLFGSPNWSLDHKGVHFSCIMSVLEEDFWTERGLTPFERMQTVAGLDNHCQRPFTVGEEMRQWLKDDLANCPDNQPIVLFSHSPLYQLYKDWNFWTEDADEVQEILSRFEKVTVIHGHTHQLLTNKIGNIHFHGLLSTAWPWPYAPQGMPELTVPMNRSDPFNSADGCGNGDILVSADGLVDKVYKIWNRKPILVSAAFLNSEGEESRPPRPNLPSY